MSQAHLKLLFFKLEQSLPDAQSHAAIVVHDPRTRHAFYFYEDPQQIIPNTTENTIPERIRLTFDEVRSVEIPVTLDATVGDIRRILLNLPKVDQGINPGGMFPWSYGNYVKRFLRELERQWLLNTGSQYADEFYNRSLKKYLGDGTF